MITDKQVSSLNRLLAQGMLLHDAAAKTNMDDKTARKYRRLQRLPSEVARPHDWRTRPDLFVDVWPDVRGQLEREPRLQAKTLFAWLQQQHPGRFADGQRRTFERRVRQWKAEHGPAKEVFFAQLHQPGRLAASDFTHMNDMGVTLAGQPFNHLLFHCVLTYSNWEHISICLSESFASLSEGLQDAFWAFGGVPERHRTDRMTLAVHHHGSLEQFTARYRALLCHYDVTGEATNPNSGNENGDVESSHGHFKQAVEQALLLRGSRDFATRDAYRQFLAGIVQQRNAGRSDKFKEEVSHLRHLPKHRLETLERLKVRVGSGSTIRVKNNTYSVPSRFIGEAVEARIGAEEIEVWYGGTLQQRMERLRGEGEARIDYRHIIDWLVRKPGAFARYRYREELFPGLVFRRSYDVLMSLDPTRADREYLRILHQAAKHGEACVGALLQRAIEEGRMPTELWIEQMLGSATPLTQTWSVQDPIIDLTQYDALLTGLHREESATTMSSDTGVAVDGGNPDEKEGEDEQGRECASAAASPHGEESRIMSSDIARTVDGCDLNRKEIEDEQGHECASEAASAGASPAGDTCGAGGGEPPGEFGGVESPAVLAGTAGTRGDAPMSASDRASAQAVAAAAGEDMVVAGFEAAAVEGGAAIAEPGERGVPGSACECDRDRRPGERENARVVRTVSRMGSAWPKDVDDALQFAGSGTAGGEARPDAAALVEADATVRGVADRRSGLRAAKSRGDGSAVHAAVGAVRARERADHDEPAVFEMGAGVQGSADDGCGGGPAGASQRDCGDAGGELPSGGGPETCEGRVSEGEVAGCGARGVVGSASLTTLRSVRSAPPTTPLVSSSCTVSSRPYS